MANAALAAMAVAQPQERKTTKDIRPEDEGYVDVYRVTYILSRYWPGVSPI